jgi:hypothetical protein
MVLKRFTLILGIVFLAVGILGFVPAFVTYPLSGDPGLGVHTGHGRLFGLFPVNVLHNLIHLAFGVWALIASRDSAQSRLFCRSNAIIYAVLAIAGFVPGLNTLFGLVPLYGHDVWLHAVVALATGYFGWAWESDQIVINRQARSNI